MAKIISAIKFRYDYRSGQVDGSSIPGGSAIGQFCNGRRRDSGLRISKLRRSLNGSALEIRLSNLMFTITFDIDTMALLGKVQADKEQVSEGDDWKMIASVPRSRRTHTVEITWRLAEQIDRSGKSLLSFVYC
jgi:hypothetical protein